LPKTKRMEIFSEQKAHQAQMCLSKKLILEDRLPTKIRYVGGVDAAYINDIGIGAVAVVDYESLELLETQTAKVQVKIPYIPTLLSFREMPPVMAAFRKIKIKPDVFLVDAQGYSHPYRCGFACHFGLAVGKPTIGAAKSRLIGEPIEINEETFLVDKGEIIGAEVTTKAGCKPVYISVGNMVSLKTAISIVRHCSKTRIPQPLLKAHRLTTVLKAGLAKQINAK
jgi:deoxyribonuclease V